MREIPAHWNTCRTKFAAKLRSGHTPSRQHPEYWEDCTIPWFGLADVWQIRDGKVEFVFETKEKISELGLANSAARLLPKGTVILSRTASVGFSAVLGVDMATTQDFVNWICGPELRSEFLLYVFRSMGHEIRRLTMGSTHQTIYMPDVGRFSTPIPPLPEQAQIVRFIRRETAKIDALIEKKERLIELLEEKRTALITHTVTKGLDPDVPMKDSGVEWLGEIPAHWEVSRGRYLFMNRKKLPHKNDSVVTAFRDGQVTLRENRRTEGYTFAIQEVGYQHVQVGDLVVNGMDAFAGAIGVSESTGKCSPEYLILESLRSDISNDYFALCLRLMAKRDFIRVACPAVRERAPRFRFEQFKAVGLPVPELSEQVAIVRSLIQDTSKLDGLKTEVHQAITLLKEHRTALISAAVTGKIDVREEAA